MLRLACDGAPGIVVRRRPARSDPEEIARGFARCPAPQPREDSNDRHHLDFLSRYGEHHPRGLLGREPCLARRSPIHLRRIAAQGAHRCTRPPSVRSPTSLRQSLSDVSGGAAVVRGARCRGPPSDVEVTRILLAGQGPIRFPTRTDHRDSASAAWARPRNLRKCFVACLLARQCLPSSRCHIDGCPQWLRPRAGRGNTGHSTTAGGKTWWARSGTRHMVLRRPRLLATLPQNEVLAGFAEVAKCGFIADPAILDLLEPTSRAPPTAAAMRSGELVESAIRREGSRGQRRLREPASARSSTTDTPSAMPSSTRALPLASWRGDRHSLWSTPPSSPTSQARSVPRPSTDTGAFFASLTLPTGYPLGRWKTPAGDDAARQEGPSGHAALHRAR